jgi:curved DNA-binding protein CbpA
LNQVAHQPTHYDVLEITPAATADQVRAAYLQMARKFHPDFYAQQPEHIRAQAEARMQLVNQAAGILSDAVRRRRYDDELRASGRLAVGPASAPSKPSKPGTSHRRAGAPNVTSDAPSAAPRTSARSGGRPLANSTLLLVVAVVLVVGGAVLDVPAVMLGGMAVAVLAAIVTLRSGAAT